MNTLHNKTELRIMIDEPWQKESIEEIAKRFEAANPGVSVLVDVVDNGVIRSELYTGESRADIVQLFCGDITDGSRDGLLLDLRPWVEAYDIEALFHPSILKLVRKGDSIAAMPISATMKGIFYNKQWFEKAEIPYPDDGWTWDDFLEIALKLQMANVNPGEERYAARISFHREYMGLLLLTAGTDWLSPDRTRASGYANSPKAVETITWATDLVRKHGVAWAMHDYFKNSDLLENNTGMILDYFIMLHENEPKLKENLGVVGLPYFRGGKRVNEPWICGFGIATRTEHPELAWQLLRELTCTSNELTRLVTQGFIAPLRSVYAEVGHDNDPLRRVVLDELAYGGPLPVSAANTDYYRLLDKYVNPEMRRIVYEGADVKETLDTIAVRMDEALAKVRPAVTAN
ncbi:extracellular solute-binding protein [Paenibacillus mesophilus]|uniref:extracellular solute-binding protein n=1 Tax=Paenibacillus mesophilus TaxID=2582849 RepID=UPI00110DA55A|nr:extracellular solute-binding protein [Paenibacillus mesophilus]TMV43757.1 extracellular solute-binding protein [Paenibacillus mesophilus]